MKYVNYKRKIYFTFLTCFTLVLMVSHLNCGKPNPSDQLGPAGESIDGLSDHVEWTNPESISVPGYSGQNTEPHIYKDAGNIECIYFADELGHREQPSNVVNVNSHVACRNVTTTSDNLFDQYRALTEINTASLDSVPSLDSNGHLFFISDRTGDLHTIFRSTFNPGTSNFENIENVDEFLTEPGFVNFDIAINSDGNRLYVSKGVFVAGHLFPDFADLVLAEKDATGKFRINPSSVILKSINTTENLEYAASVSKDELTIFYTQLVPTNPPHFKINYATRNSKTEPFKIPRTITSVGDEFVEAPSLSQDGQRLIYHIKDSTSGLFKLRMVRKK